MADTDHVFVAPEHWCEGFGKTREKGFHQYLRLRVSDPAQGTNLKYKKKVDVAIPCVWTNSFKSWVNLGRYLETPDQIAS